MLFPAVLVYINDLAAGGFCWSTAISPQPHSGHEQGKFCGRLCSVHARDIALDFGVVQQGRNTNILGSPGAHLCQQATSLAKAWVG
jgi:hypothetical protein